MFWILSFRQVFKLLVFGVVIFHFPIKSCIYFRKLLLYKIQYPAANGAIAVLISVICTAAVLVLLMTRGSVLDGEVSKSKVFVLCFTRKLLIFGNNCIKSTLHYWMWMMIPTIYFRFMPSHLKAQRLKYTKL